MKLWMFSLLAGFAAAFVIDYGSRRLTRREQRTDYSDCAHNK